MNFGSLLSFLISIANSSISELAADLSYDRSYISKWVNNKELPTHQKWEELHKNLVEFFDMRISELAIEKLILQYPVLKIQSLKKTKRDLISYSLDFSYESTEGMLGVFDGQESDTVLFINGRRKIEDFIIKLLTKEIHRVTDPGTLYFKGDLVSLISDETLDNFHIGLISPQTFSLNFSTSNFLDELTDKKTRIQLINKYFRLISQFSYIKLELYWPKNQNKEMVELAAKNILYGWGFEVENDVPKLAFISYDPKQIERRNSNMAKDFNDEEKVFAIEENMKSIISSLNYINSMAKPKIYIPRLFIFMGPDRLRKDLYEKRYINKYENEI